MRRFKRIITAFFILVTSTMLAKGQSSATATVSAAIEAPLELEILRQQDTTFTVSISSTTNETVFVIGKGKKNDEISGRIGVADFTVNSLDPLTYAVTLPGTITLTHSSGAQKMEASTFLNNTNSKALTIGTKSFHLFAEVKMNDLKLSGLYSSEMFPVTINHN